MVFKTIRGILLCYNDILLLINEYAYNCPTSYSLGKNKFEEVRKKLFEFLYMHKDLIKLNAIVFKNNETNISKKVRFYYLNDASKLLDINNYLKAARGKDWNLSRTSIENLKKKYSIRLEIIYNRKNTLRALKNFFGVETLSEKSMANLSGNFFIGNKILFKTYQTASYKNILENLKNYYSELYINVRLVYRIINTTNAYIRFLCDITVVDVKSNDYCLHVRKFNEVLKEFYEFAVAHKSIIKLRNVYIAHSSKTKVEFSKVNFDYSKKGLNFLSFDGLYHLNFKIESWCERFCKEVYVDCSFDFNNQNLKNVINSSINKNSKSVEELKKLCFDTFLGKKNSKKSQKSSSYEDLQKTLSKRHDALWERKVSRTHLDQLCFTHEGSTDENGEKLKCNICLGELEIGAEVCRLPCGHINCKTCIEEWFDIRTENSDEKNNDTSVGDDVGVLIEEHNETLDENDTALDRNVNGTSDEYHVEIANKDENKNSNENSSGDIKASDGNSDEAFALDSEASKLEEASSNLVESPVIVDNDTPSSDVYWNEYVVDDNEEQKARNQCPICKHICS